MSTNLGVSASFNVLFEDGDKTTFGFGSQGDFTISNPARGTSGRALVVANEKLHLNWDNDFSGGVQINGNVQLTSLNVTNLSGLSTITGLAAAPAGVNTFDVVIDADGNVYKKD